MRIAVVELIDERGLNEETASDCGDRTWRPRRTGGIRVGGTAYGESRPADKQDANAKGEARNDLVMRLSLTRGDVIGQLMKTCRNDSLEPAFRALALELLFKRSVSEADQRLKDVFLEALRSSEPVIRRAAAGGVLTYCDDQDVQRELGKMVGDEDELVRTQAYTVLLAADQEDGRTEGVLDGLEKEERAVIVDACTAQLPRETDPEMRMLCKSVLGWEIGARCNEATEALQKGETDTARELIESALAMDPRNQQAQVENGEILPGHRQSETGRGNGKAIRGAHRGPQTLRGAGHRRRSLG